MKKPMILIIHIVRSNHSPNLDVQRTPWKFSIGPKDLKIKRGTIKYGQKLPPTWHPCSVGILHRKYVHAVVGILHRKCVHIEDTE